LVSRDRKPLARGLDRAMQPIFEHRTRRQLSQVLGDVDPARVEVKVLDRLALLASA
jgi:hypothetical protein